MKTAAAPFLHSLDAERAVLGGLMLEPDALARVDWLTEADFFLERHRIVFRAVAELATRGEPCDSVTMGEWFEANGLGDLIGGPVFLLELSNATPSSANVQAYAEIVKEKARLRMVADAFEKAKAAALEPGAASATIIAQAVQDLSQFQTTHYQGGLLEVKPILRRVRAELQRRYDSKPGLLGLPTPWQDLNKATKGLRNGALYVIGGRPSMGKTVMGLNLAGFTALRGDNTLVFSAEMTADECMVRMIAAAGDIPHDWLEQPTDDWDGSELYWSRNTDTCAKLLGAPLLIDETPAIRIDQLMARARKAHRQRAARLIVIDHLHDMDHGGKPEMIRHAIGRSVQGMKTLAKELDCPVVCLAQLNRGSEGEHGKRPVLKSLREAGEIEQKADVVLFLHRDDYYNPESNPGVVTVIPAKGRNIRLGEAISLRNRFDCMRMDDWDGALPTQTREAPTRATRGYDWRERHERAEA